MSTVLDGTVSSILSSDEEENKGNINMKKTICLLRPWLCMLCWQIFGCTTNSSLKTLTYRLAFVGIVQNSQVLVRLRAQIAVAVTRTSSMCIQGTQKKAISKFHRFWWWSWGPNSNLNDCQQFKKNMMSSKLL